MCCREQPQLRMLTPLQKRCGELMGTAVMSDRPERLDKQGKTDMETPATRATQKQQCTGVAENHHSTSVFGTLKVVSLNHIDSDEV